MQPRLSGYGSHSTRPERWHRPCVQLESGPPGERVCSVGSAFTGASGALSTAWQLPPRGARGLAQLCVAGLPGWPQSPEGLKDSLGCAHTGRKDDRGACAALSGPPDWPGPCVTAGCHHKPWPFSWLLWNLARCPASAESPRALDVCWFCPSGGSLSSVRVSCPRLGLAEAVTGTCWSPANGWH